MPVLGKADAPFENVNAGAESTTLVRVSFVRVFSPPPKTRRKKQKKKKEKNWHTQKIREPRSFLVSPRFLYFSRDQKFNEWRLESTGGKGAKRGIKKGGKWTASKSASLVAVRQIYAAICASNNLAGTMKRVPTKFFSGHAAALARDAINSRP